MTQSIRRLLVTGSSGFVGRHVLAAVEEGVFGDVDVHCMPRSVDLRDADSVAAAVHLLRPDQVLHLAGQSFVPRSFDAPAETFQINLIGTLNLLLALRSASFAGRMVYVSSGDVYGQLAESDMPVDERTVPHPRSPYGVSKVSAEQLCLQWNRTEGLDVMIARPFNHIGPGQADQFVVPSLARQVAEIRDGLRPAVIEAGDIDVTRDFTDVRDVVAAYAAMFAHGHPGSTYVVGSGKERSIRSLLEALLGLAGVAAEVRQDAKKIRPSEQRRMWSDPGLLRRETGWVARIPMETTLEQILMDVRTKQ
ncbi:NAD-dependent epimerase/dehydratase family protein [Stenotrophomonas maltophilia]|uniref:GDP-mannose 4,6-dehydratase n=1 Tax=Stenotrophomonas maltophilia TaxID=40324 RepID=UPI001313337C|nr:GDP-mannose 4,6-dehydratase [Stenotrophomonas maltophilia]MBA0394967.1 NAD-dependent epimerase/dehydratase family protein [Stenotrophomonas maltophilia]